MLRVFQITKFIFRHCVPRPLRYPMARLAGRLLLILRPRRRKTLIENLTPFVGAQAASDMAQKQIGHFAMTAVDFFCFPRGLVNKIDVVNGQILDKTYRKAHKAIVVTAHIGNWELGISLLVARGFPVAGMYAPYREDEVVQWILAHRISEVEWIPSSKGAARSCIDALNRGKMLGIVGDIPFGERGRRVKMAGRYVHLPLGPWAIAARAEAPVIPAFMLRVRPGHYQAIFHEPIWPVAGGSLRSQMESMQEIYKAHLEKAIREHPEQWGVLQPFWDHV